MQKQQEGREEASLTVEIDITEQLWHQLNCSLKVSVSENHFNEYPLQVAEAS